MKYNGANVTCQVFNIVAVTANFSFAQITAFVWE